MATSEYIRKSNAAEQSATTGFPVPRRSRSGVVGPQMVTSLVMMLNDAVAILLAFGTALVLRSTIVEEGSQFSAVFHSLTRAPVNLIYLVWFILAYALVARRYGLYSPIPLSTGAHELR